MTSLTTVILNGELFDGVTPLPHPARLELEGEIGRLDVDGQALAVASSALRVSPRVFDAPRFVALPNGWQLQCADQVALDGLPAASKSEGLVTWLERRVWVAVAAVIATLAGVALLYVFGLPRLAAAVAERVSPERERAFGESALATLSNGKSSATDLDDETIAQVRNGFAALRGGLPKGVYTRLEFRNEPAIGPNAFALPGGIIVITDQLVTMCTPDESVAVLAHELGHVEYRHALRHLLQEFGVGALGALLGTDASSLSLSSASLPLILAEANYSQRFEAEADAAGFALSERAGYSPDLFASCLQRISKKMGTGELGVLSYASSHPPDAERIARAHAAALAFARRRGK